MLSGVSQQGHSRLRGGFGGGAVKPWEMEIEPACRAEDSEQGPQLEGLEGEEPL